METHNATPLRVALIGSGRRSREVYGPILQSMSGVELVGIWNRSETSARALGESLGVPFFTSMQQMIDETAPAIGVVSVGYGANGEIGLMAVEHGLHVLLETPIAHDLDEADAIITAAQERGLKVEVAEQYYRYPNQQIKLQLIETGVFGRVHSSFNDFWAHGYHGVSIMRGHLGFDAKPLQVVGAVRNYPLAPTWSSLADGAGALEETQEHGIIQFEGGGIGAYHWTSVGYDSPLRPWRSSRFLAEKGAGIAVGSYAESEEQLTLLSADGTTPQRISLQRRFADNGTLRSVVAHLENELLGEWQCPVRQQIGENDALWNDDQIGVAGCIQSLVDAVRGDTQPSYGAHQARLDQEIILALGQSSKNDGQPIRLPLSGN